jgi:hypothetical protein
MRRRDEPAISWPEKKMLTDEELAKVRADFREALKHRAPNVLNDQHEESSQ